MDDIKSTIIKTVLTGFGVLGLVFLTIVFAGLSRQTLLFLIVFVLLAVLAGFVAYLTWNVRHLEGLVDQLLAEKKEETLPK